TAIKATKATSASGRRDKQNDIRLRNMDVSASRRGAIDEQAASAHDVFAVAQPVDDLDHRAIGQADLDLTPFDRFVVACNPDMGGLSVVNDCLTWHRQRRVSLASKNGNVCKHLWPQELSRIVDCRANQQPARSGIERGCDEGNIRR